MIKPFDMLRDRKVVTLFVECDETTDVYRDTSKPLRTFEGTVYAVQKSYPCSGDTFGYTPSREAAEKNAAYSAKTSGFGSKYDVIVVQEPTGKQPETLVLDGYVIHGQSCTYVHEQDRGKAMALFLELFTKPAVAWFTSPGEGHNAGRLVLEVWTSMNCGYQTPVHVLQLRTFTLETL